MRDADQSTSISSSAFTLVELLVVVGIIAVLISMLLPALSRARYQARTVACASDLRQLLLTFHTYADDNKGVLPRFDNPTGAANLSDLPVEFHDTMQQVYAIPEPSFYCPFSDEALPEYNVQNTSEFCLGYAIWVPHLCTGVLVPPDPWSGSGLGVNGTQQLSGPIKLGDPIGLVNPIITDPIYLYLSAVGNPARFDFTNAPESDYWYVFGAHFWGGHLDSVNEGYVDGHVDRHGARDLQCRYQSYNSWLAR